MGDLFTAAKRSLYVGMMHRASIAAAIAVSVIAFAFGDGGTLIVSWQPGGAE